MTDFQKLTPEQYRQMSLKEIADTLPEGWWVAVDQNRMLWVYPEEPRRGKRLWRCLYGRVLCRYYPLKDQDWKTTATQSQAKGISVETNTEPTVEEARSKLLEIVAEAEKAGYLDDQWEYASVDRSGYAYAYVKKPVKNLHGGNVWYGAGVYVGRLEGRVVDWEKTLVSRKDLEIANKTNKPIEVVAGGEYELKGGKRWHCYEPANDLHPEIHHGRSLYDDGTWVNDSQFANDTFMPYTPKPIIPKAHLDGFKALGYCSLRHCEHALPKWQICYPVESPGDYEDEYIWSPVPAYISDQWQLNGCTDEQSLVVFGEGE